MHVKKKSKKFGITNAIKTKSLFDGMHNIGLNARSVFVVG